MAKQFNFPQVGDAAIQAALGRISIQELTNDVALALLTYPINPDAFGYAIEVYLNSVSVPKVVIALPDTPDFIKLEGGASITHLKSAVPYMKNPNFAGLIFYSNNQIITFLGNVLSQLAGKGEDVRSAASIRGLEDAFRHVVNNKEAKLPPEFYALKPDYLNEP